MEGPMEFLQGIAKGSRFLFGSVVGGAAGALAKVSSSASKGLATLTLDKDYQNIRIQRKELIPQSKSTTDLLAAGKNTGKVSGSVTIQCVDRLSFLQDFVMGVKGLVKKPLQGAKRKGNTGLVKGLGKGFLGLFARPTSALADLTSQSFNYVKRSFSRRPLSSRHEEIYLELSTTKRLFIGFVNLGISGEIDWFDPRLLHETFGFHLFEVRLSDSRLDCRFKQISLLECSGRSIRCDWDLRCTHSLFFISTSILSSCIDQVRFRLV